MALNEFNQMEINKVRLGYLFLLWNVEISQQASECNM